MQVLTELKSMFSYSIVPIIVLLFLIIIIIIILKLINKIKLKKQVVIPNHKELIDIKKRYLLRIQELENNLSNNSISSRKAYQSLSNLIRTFIYEATNIKVQNYTLKEINTLNMPILSDLVTEYYDPEFSVISKGNIISSINKTKGVIEKWN